MSITVSRVTYNDKLTQLIVTKAKQQDIPFDELKKRAKEIIITSEDLAGLVEKGKAPIGDLNGFVEKAVSVLLTKKNSGATRALFEVQNAERGKSEPAAEIPQVESTPAESIPAEPSAGSPPVVEQQSGGSSGVELPSGGGNNGNPDDKKTDYVGWGGLIVGALLAIGSFIASADDKTKVGLGIIGALIAALCNPWYKLFCGGDKKEDALKPT